MFAALVLGLVLGSCAQDWAVPIVPVPVVPPAPPVPPMPPPPPAPVSGVATWNAVKAVEVGMARAAAEAALAVAPAFASDQGDGVWAATYASVGPAGEPEYLAVRFRDGKVVGRSRLPRAAPSLPAASLPSGEIDLGHYCVEGDPGCEVPRR